MQHGSHHLVNNTSLTVFAGETLVLLGENGAGKSALIQTIAAMQHVHSGSARAFGQDLFNGYRFSKDNFLSLCDTEPILIDLMTPTEHIKFLSPFLGKNIDDAKIQEKLAEFRL